MKKIQYLFILLLFAFSALGSTVNRSKVNDFASNFLLQQSENNYTISSVEEIKYNGITTSYLYNLDPVGFIILSADDKVAPLLAYSFESNSTITSDIPDQLSLWLNNANHQIIKQINNPTASKNRAWDMQGSLKSATATTIAPMLKVRWNQGSGFNQFCPENTDGKALVGCVAVAMAQGMSYYESPTKGTGKASYIHEVYGTQSVNFENEAPYQWDSMPPSSGNVHNARLLYHAAVTVSMDFGPDGSGSFTKNAVGALKTYFNYSKTTTLVDRIEDDEEWKALLIENLAQGYPIIYDGNPTEGGSGHCWNIDGVDASGVFHVNWGWGGSNNGYFNIDNLAPGSYNFLEDQAAVLGFKPKVPGPLDIVLSANEVREKLPAGSFVATVKVDDEFPDNEYTYNLKGNPIVIGDGFAPPKFYIENDTLKTIEEFSYEKRQKYTLFIEAVDSYGNSLEKMFEININSAVGINDFSKTDQIKVYPNPFNESITVEIEKESTFAIYTIQGQKVFDRKLSVSTQNLDVSKLNKGSYIVKIENKDGRFFSRFVKQ